jgi:hypothetical protein
VRRFLRVTSSATAVTDIRHRSDASIFALYKADVTNANRPSTCDEQARDGDYGYLRGLGPSTWLRVSGGALKAAHPTLPSEESVHPSPPEGAANSVADQVCRTDERNQMLCGWVPRCLGP